MSDDLLERMKHSHQRTRELETQVQGLQAELEFLPKVMRLLAEHECQEDVHWTKDLKVMVNCSDFFAWGCSDYEDVTPETFDEFEQAMKDGAVSGPLLYCARSRKSRPQGAYYKYIDESLWPLFNKCGPERETGMGNPHPIPAPTEHKDAD